LINSGHIKYRLYRQHTSPFGNLIVKDLSKIGRNLSKTIIVDNVADNFALQRENGIFIKTWYDDMSDTSLYDLIPLLLGIAK
jgi:CTD small phosphatase-like protein 2